MSENWNAWNPNTEDDDFDALEAKKRDEKEQEAKKWAELLFNKDSEPEEENTSIFATVEKVDEAGEETDDTFKEAEETADSPDAEDPDQTILEQPTFREDDPGEDALAQSEDETFSEKEGPEDSQEEPSAIEGIEEDVPETENEHASEVIDDQDSENPGEEMQQQEFTADQDDEDQAKQEVAQVEPEEDDPEQESTLRIDRSELIDEPAEDIVEEEPAPEEASELDVAETDNTDSGAEVEDAAIANEEYRPPEGDQSEIISSEEAEELEAQLETTEDPDQTILEQPTFREDDPSELEVSEQETRTIEEEQELKAEADEAAEAAATAASAAASTRYIGGRRVKKVGENENEHPDQASDSESQDKPVAEEMTDPMLGSGETLEQEEPEDEEESAEELDDDGEINQEQAKEKDTEDEEDALKAAAYIYAATEALKRRPESDVETDEDEKTAIASNQELSSQTHEDIDNVSSEEVDVERLADHPEMQPYDPEAESFDKRQETISQGPPKDAAEYYGEAQSSQDVTPISDILADKEQQIANFNADSTDISQINQDIHADKNINVRNYKSAIITGVITGVIIITLSILYFLFRGGVI
ncbi:MAG TPA: hypothetical protein VD947_00350 [Patescibacteria group bacterium]|nr:hypothetical protein [Patescibacteria group bacterium]